MRIGDAQLRIGRRAAIGSAATVAGLVALVATPQLLGAQMERAVGELRVADPRWLALACLGFLASIVCSAQSWRVAARSLGGSVGRFEAVARFSVGALVNTFVPAKLGEAVRMALFARVLPGGQRAWGAAGILGAIGVARTIVIALTVVGAAAAGILPLWPVFALLGAAAAVVGTAAVVRRRTGSTRLARLLDALAVFVRSPGIAARVLGWSVGVSVARVVAATAAAAALGLPHPFVAALIIVPALDLAGTLPLTPGNVGITSGAVALALRAHGIGTTKALSTGIAFHAAEMLVGVSTGLAAVLLLAGFPRVARIAFAGAALAAAAAAFAVAAVY